MFMKEKLGINIPDEYIKRLATAASPLDEGIKIAAELISAMKPQVQGVHIMALGLEEHIPEILNKVSEQQEASCAGAEDIRSVLKEILIRS